MRILTIGDNVADCYMDKGVYYPGGNSVNVAVGCKRNGACEVGYIGIIGNDKEADHIVSVLNTEGIDISHCRKVCLPSGHPQVGHREDRDRFFIKSPKNTCQHMVRIGLIEEDYAYIKDFTHIHTSIFSYIDSELENLHKYCSVSYDFSNITDNNRIKKICPHVDIAFFSASHMNNEERMDLIKFVHSYKTPVVGLTLGSEGALFSTRGRLYTQGIKETNVVDTMGAGDSFISAFLVAYKNGESLDSALDKAAAYAAKSCGENGAFGYGKPLEVEFLMENK